MEVQQETKEVEAGNAKKQTELDAKNATIEEMIKAVDTRRPGIEQQLADVRKSNSALSLDNEKLEAKIAGKVVETEVLKAECEELHNQCDALKEVLMQVEGLSKANGVVLAERKEQTEEALPRALNEVKDLERQVSLAERERQVFQANIANLKADLQLQHDATAADLQAQINKAKENKARANEKAAELREEAAKLTADHQSWMANFQRQSQESFDDKVAGVVAKARMDIEAENEAVFRETMRAFHEDLAAAAIPPLIADDDVIGMYDDVIGDINFSDVEMQGDIVQQRSNDNDDKSSIHSIEIATTNYFKALAANRAWLEAKAAAAANGPLHLQDAKATANLPSSEALQQSANVAIAEIGAHGGVSKSASQQSVSSNWTLSSGVSETNKKPSIFDLKPSIQASQQSTTAAIADEVAQGGVSRTKKPSIFDLPSSQISLPNATAAIADEGAHGTNKKRSIFDLDTDGPLHLQDAKAANGPLHLPSSQALQQSATAAIADEGAHGNVTQQSVSSTLGTAGGAS